MLCKRGSQLSISVWIRLFLALWQYFLQSCLNRLEWLKISGKNLTIRFMLDKICEKINQKLKILRLIEWENTKNDGKWESKKITNLKKKGKTKNMRNEITI